MHTSDAGVQFIANFEGFRGSPYRDAVGVWTIGYGHTHGVGPNSRPITRAQALELLKRDLATEYEAGVTRYVKVALNQNQFDALVSFVYNLGTGILPGSSLLAAINSRRWKSAADHMLAYDHAGGQVLEGLRRRRQAEAALFLKRAKPVNAKLARWRGELAKLRREAQKRKKAGKQSWTLAMRVKARTLKALIKREERKS